MHQLLVNAIGKGLLCGSFAWLVLTPVAKGRNGPFPDRHLRTFAQNGRFKAKVDGTVMPDDMQLRPSLGVVRIPVHFGSPMAEQRIRLSLFMLRTGQVVVPLK